MNGEDAAKIGSVLDFLVKGGPVMIPIGVASIVALTLIVERLVSLRRRKIIPPEFLPGLQAELRNGNGDRKPALAYCQANPSPIASIFTAGVKNLSAPVERLEKLVQEAGEREVMHLRKGMRVLSVIPNVATLLGLLGTILGLIKAFQTVATSGGESLGKAEMLAEGIYEAMITTAAGLIVAIPVLLAYHWIAARIDGLVREMDRMTVEFVEEHAGSAMPPVEVPRPVPRDEPAELPAAAIAAA
ncbi:MAG TPA: MotA/TolQ/ExbB proton channel family protein [Phycisphaerae bacterium]|jgi:biopolymer transport protein ExbB